MTPCQASGSACSDKSIEPLTSANKTVTCFRSPSSVARVARILSARWLGVYETGGESERAWPAATAVPHSGQNLVVALIGCPHPGQARGKAVPHSSQNLAPALFTCLQDGQFIRASSRVHLGQ